MPVGGQHVVVPMSHILALWLSTCTLVGKLKSLVLSHSFARLVLVWDVQFSRIFGFGPIIIGHYWLRSFRFIIFDQVWFCYHIFFLLSFLDLEMCSKCKDCFANLVMVVWFHYDFVNHSTDWILTSFWSFTELGDHHNIIRMIIIIIHFVVEVRTGRDCCHSQFLHSTSKWLRPIQVP